MKEEKQERQKARWTDYIMNKNMEELRNAAEGKWGGASEFIMSHKVRDDWKTGRESDSTLISNKVCFCKSIR